MRLNKTCFKIDKPNAYAMIRGLQKDGKHIRQSIWLAVSGNVDDFPKLITLQKKTKFKLSPKGKELNAKDFIIPYKYIAKLDSEYFIKNDPALWKTICSNGLFDIWDPSQPYRRFNESKSPESKFRIQLLRIYEIDHELDIIESSHDMNPPKLKSPIPDVKEKLPPVISDEEFVKLKDKLERSVAPYLTRPPKHYEITSPKAPLTIDDITGKDIELIESEEDEFPEGRSFTRTHKLRERNPQASIQKKENVLKKTGTLACEVCGFDFHTTYGALGYGFAECHHRIPLSELTESQLTKLEDLAIVCANCHRMLHKARPWKTIEELKKIITDAVQYHP
jgi:hypothetical protein